RDPSRADLARDCGQDLDRVEKSPGLDTLEHQVQETVFGRGDVLEDFHGGRIHSAGVGGDVDARRRLCVDSKADVSQRVGGHPGLGEVQVELIYAGIERDGV